MQSSHPVKSSFLWGVATSAYQSEGGYNGPGQPHTNWAQAEIDHLVDPVGDAAGFWTYYHHDFMMCRRLGLNAFRLSIEWSRVQPSPILSTNSIPEFDASAILEYSKILDCCLDNGLEPIITLHHFVHPAWLGQDPWLSSETTGLFLAYVKKIVVDINNYLISKGRPPLRYFITINEPNMLVMNTYLSSQFPSSSRGGINTAIHAINNLLITHIKAYNLIHDLYLSHNWGKVYITTNNYTSDIYWLDKAIFDLLHMRERQIHFTDCYDTLIYKSDEFHRFLSSHCLSILSPYQQFFGNIAKRLLQHFIHHKLTKESFLPVLNCLYESPRDSTLDLIAIDYYDPFTAHLFKMPRLVDFSFGHSDLINTIKYSFFSRWWDWRVLPEGLSLFSEFYINDYNSKPLLIAENGMAHRRYKNNHIIQRRDGVLRSQYLVLHVGEVLSMLRRGIPIMGYMHWSLFDNYEWGSYAARFGLYSLDYTKGVERSAYDPYGDCPSETYASLVRAHCE
jgi:6-phospho-beta-galactosidase